MLHGLRAIFRLIWAQSDVGGGCCSRRTVRATSLAACCSCPELDPSRVMLRGRASARNLLAASSAQLHAKNDGAHAGSRKSDMWPYSAKPRARGLRYHHIGAVRVQSGRRAPTLKALNATDTCRVMRSFQAESHSTRGYPLFTGGQTCLTDRRAGLFNRRTCAGHSQPWCHVANDGEPERAKPRDI